MKRIGSLGAGLVATGVATWLFTPSNVTWGNHHYVKYVLATALIVVGVVFLIVGTRR